MPADFEFEESQSDALAQFKLSMALSHRQATHALLPSLSAVAASVLTQNRSLATWAKFGRAAPPGHLESFEADTWYTLKEFQQLASQRVSDYFRLTLSLLSSFCLGHNLNTVPPAPAVPHRTLGP